MPRKIKFTKSKRLFGIKRTKKTKNTRKFKTHKEFLEKFDDYDNLPLCKLSSKMPRFRLANANDKTGPGDKNCLNLAFTHFEYTLFLRWSAWNRKINGSRCPKGVPCMNGLIKSNGLPAPLNTNLPDTLIFFSHHGPVMILPRDKDSHHFVKMDEADDIKLIHVSLILLPAPQRSVTPVATACCPAGSSNQENWEADSKPVKGERPALVADDEMAGAIVAHLRINPHLLRDFVLRIQHRRAAMARGQNERGQPLHGYPLPNDIIMGIPAIRLAQAFIDARAAVPVPPIPFRAIRPAPEPNNEPAELVGKDATNSNENLVPAN